MTSETSTFQTLSEKDFIRLLGADKTGLPEECRRLIRELDFGYEPLTEAETQQAFERVRVRLEGWADASGAHRLERWETGWGENLEEFISSGYDTQKLIPKFVRPNEPLRIDGRYVRPRDPWLEDHIVQVLRAYLFLTYFKDVEKIHEFGCGTSHNLIHLAKLIPHKTLHGLDWSISAVKIIDVLRQELKLPIQGHRFDLFNPDMLYALHPEDGMYTVGTLEQLGTNFGPFLDFLLEKKPKVCIHVETLHEKYDPAVEFDLWAIKYLEKRNYLRGFLPALQQFEKEGKAKIIHVKRFFGSFYHEGYSICVWKPL